MCVCERESERKRNEIFTVYKLSLSTSEIATVFISHTNAHTHTLLTKYNSMKS